CRHTARQQPRNRIKSRKLMLARAVVKRGYIHCRAELEGKLGCFGKQRMTAIDVSRQYLIGGYFGVAEQAPQRFQPAFAVADMKMANAMFTRQHGTDAGLGHQAL